MKYFNITIFLFSFFLTAISCGQRDNFNSIGEDSAETVLSSGDDSQTVLSSGDDSHRDEIVKLVNNREIIKIGGKDKKRLPAHLSQTVGQNNLKNKDKNSRRAHNKGPKNVKVDTTVRIELVVKHKPGKPSKAKMNKKNLSLLMYFDNKRENCLNRIKNGYKGFISAMNQIHSWKMLFAFHTDDNAETLPLRSPWGSEHILHKGSEHALKDFYTTLDFEHEHGSSEVGNRNRFIHTQYKSYSSDHPLQGLDNILSSKVPSADKKIVLYFDSNFPHTTAKDWKNLYNKHKDLSILAIASKRANFSNIEAGFNAGVDLVPIHNCQMENIAAHILDRSL